MIIETVECQDDVNFYEENKFASDIKKYCPVWKKSDFLYGDYYQNKSSWLRLALHKCDQKKWSSMNASCATDDQINTYFKQNLIGFEI